LGASRGEVGGWFAKHGVALPHHSLDALKFKAMWFTKVIYSDKFTVTNVPD